MSIIKILGLGIMMRGFIMYKYEKHLAFPVNIKKKDLSEIEEDDYNKISNIQKVVLLAL